MGTQVEQSSEFLPRTSRTSRRHLEDMADSLHRLPSAAEDLQVIIPRRNRTLLLQGEFRITLMESSVECIYQAWREPSVNSAGTVRKRLAVSDLSGRLVPASTASV